jgi:hypothetical protein
VQIVPYSLPKVPKAAPVASSSTLAVAEKANGQDQLGSEYAVASPTVEQMRMGGALAAGRQRSQARGEQTNTTRGSIVRPIEKAPALNKGAVTAQNSPRA